MYLISAEGYKNANVYCLKIRKTGEIWVSMKDVGSRMGVKNIFDLVLKEIYGIYEKKELTKEEIKNYKITEREIYKKYDNLSEDELNEKSNKNTDMKNIIKHCRDEKKKKRNKSNRQIYFSKFI